MSFREHAEKAHFMETPEPSIHKKVCCGPLVGRIPLAIPCRGWVSRTDEVLAAPPPFRVSVSLRFLGMNSRGRSSQNFSKSPNPKP